MDKVLRHVLIAFTAIYLNMLLNIRVSVANSIKFASLFWPLEHFDTKR
jgi:hypothetical protein